MAAGRVVTEPFAARTAAIQTQEISRHPTFVEEHILANVAQREPRLPAATVSDDVGSTLFVGVDGFF